MEATIERAYKAPVGDEERIKLLLQHILGFMDVADRNGKDLLIKRENGYVVVYYVPR